MSCGAFVVATETMCPAKIPLALFREDLPTPPKRLILILRTAYGEVGFEIPSGVLLAKNTNVLG